MEGGWKDLSQEWSSGWGYCATESYQQVDAETVVGLAQDLEPLKWTEEEPLEQPLDEALVRTVALSSGGVLSPMVAMLGAVAAQEVLKVGTGIGVGGTGKMWRSVCVSEGTQHQIAALEASPTWV